MHTSKMSALHWYAVFTACATFVLLIAGALVTSNDAGLSIPDWPLAYGSLTPPMVGGIRYEFTHRVIAACVGLLTVGLAAWLWRSESRPWMRWLGLAALGGVISQAILGGLTVRMVQPPPVSAAHATLAQLFFSTVVAIAIFTSQWWQANGPAFEDTVTPKLRSLTVWTGVAVFLQLILGAAFRHKGFGIVPHLVGAVVVTALVFLTASALKRRFPGAQPLLGCARALHALIGLQLLLGAGAWWSRQYGAQFPQPVPVTVTLTVVHTVMGALVLAATVITALLVYRLVRAEAGTLLARSSAEAERAA
jgi:cytochrome c oxidase assembly protein subunit 15